MDKNKNLYKIVKQLLQPSKGILAADQSANTMNKQLEGIGVSPDAEMRRTYRQILFTTEHLENYVSGVIMFDSSIKNQTDEGVPFVDVLLAKGIIPIIKVDKSTVPHTGFNGEVVTQGLDGLRERLAEYYEMGARAAKWRSVFNITDELPSEQNIVFDAMTLARYATLCQEAGIVPIVEPEVIYGGSHSIERAEEVTTRVLKKVFEILNWYRVDIGAMILKSSMVLAGKKNEHPSTPEEVADATVRTFRNSVPDELTGIVFLSGGQTPEQATVNLNAIAEIEKAENSLPWEIAFSFSRGLEQPVQQAWQGKPENILKAQEALIERLQLNIQADSGNYEASLEK